ncbi:hypothetical protein SAICODRAFT_31883 [Saitoella complicata NRRL Y-17804]|nr:uncharacterized protein SAICODRAFT_31883 [Saitoella complicata NRRL Y-17804]ODQ50613.1 hypothetical protein SAICODRAFT_31883 [Saitoella complicata NRRL Y-17804]
MSDNDSLPDVDSAIHPGHPPEENLDPELMLDLINDLSAESKRILDLLLDDTVNFEPRVREMHEDGPKSRRFALFLRRFADTQQYFSSGTTFIDVEKVLSYLDDEEEGVAKHRTMLRMANYASLASSVLTQTNPDSMTDRYEALIETDDVFPEYFGASMKLAAPISVEIRTQLFISMMALALAPEEEDPNVPQFIVEAFNRPGARKPTGQFAKLCAARMKVLQDIDWKDDEAALACLQKYSWFRFVAIVWAFAKERVEELEQEGEDFSEGEYSDEEVGEEALAPDVVEYLLEPGRIARRSLGAVEIEATLQQETQARVDVFEDQPEVVEAFDEEEEEPPKELTLKGRQSPRKKGSLLDRQETAEKVTFESQGSPTPGRSAGPAPRRSQRKRGKQPEESDAEGFNDDIVPNQDKTNKRRKGSKRRQEEEGALAAVNEEDVDLDATQVERENGDTEEIAQREGWEDELDPPTTEETQKKPKVEFKQRREDDQHDEADEDENEDEGDQQRPREGSLTVSDLHRARGRANALSRRRAAARPRQTRTPWSLEEESCLLSALQRYGCQWALIEKKHGRTGSVDQVLRERGQVSLKDKARNMKLAFLRAGGEVPWELRAVTGRVQVEVGVEADDRADEEAKGEEEEEEVEEDA